MEALEPRIVLSAVTSVSDSGISFSADDENLFNNQAGISKNFDYTLFDESFGFTLGGFTAGTGVKASFAGGIELGLNGGFNVGGGTFDVDYLTDVDITTAGVDGSNINSLVAGDHFSITASETPDASGIAMTSQVTGLDTDLNIVAKVDAGINVKAKFAGKTVINEGVNFDLAPGNINVFDIGADLSTGDLDFSIFGEDILALLDETDVLNIVDRGIEYNFGAVEGGIYVPQLDTGVAGDGFDDSNWNGDKIVNKHLPVDLSQPVTRIDYLHVGFDAAEFLLSKIPVSPAGIPTEFPELELTNDIKLEDFHVLDGVFSAHFGVAQELTFEPELVIDLTFTDELGAAKTAFVETFVGSGEFTAVTSKRIEAGTTVEIIHTGGELNIDTDYVLSGTFKNETKLYITPAFDLNVLDGIVQVDLNRFDNLDLFSTSDLIFRDHFTAFSQSFAFSSPIPIKNLIDSSVTVNSFAEVDGSDLSLTATPSVDFQAIVGVSELSIVEGETLTASMVISDPNAAADDSDVYEVVIDWQDGATETLTLDNSGSLPAHATYDALNHVLVVSHEYVEDTATQPDPSLSPTTFDATISFQATKLTPRSVNVNETHTDAVVIEVLNVGPDVTIDELSIDNVGNATLEASYVDQGVQDSHEIVIQNWGDSESTGFDLPDPGSLNIGDTFNATSGSELLTITFVDAATGNVSFTVTGHTYTQVTRGQLNLLVMDDERNGGIALARVPFGLDLTQFNLPSSTPENGDVTFSATFKAERNPFSSSLFFFSYDVVVDWDDANDPGLSSFRLDIADEIAHELTVGDQFNSSTDDSVLTITQLTQVDKVRHDDYNLVVSFDVTHRYLDDGLAGGNGTASDTSTVVLEIFELVFSDRRGATANQTINVVNQAPTVALAPFDGEIGNGGVAVLFGELADPGTLDAITLSVDWGDGSIDTHLFGASDVAQPFSLGHVYATEGNFTIQARVTDDDTDVDQISLPVVVDFASPPLAVDDEVTTTEDAAVVIDVLADNGNGVDSDPDGDLDPTLTVQSGSLTGGGILTDLGNGSFQYDPNGQFEHLAAGESAPVQFSYQIEDSTGQLAVGTVNISVTGANDAPAVMVNQPLVEVDEGGLATNSGSFTDVDASDSVTITASVGTITQDAGNSGAWAWSFDTADGPDQSQTVVITADDGNDGIATTTLALTVNNVAPSIAADGGTVIVNEGDTATNTGTFSDPGADVVTITASIGTVMQSDTTGTWAWSFDTADGPDDSQTVTVTATDTDGASTSTTFGLTVNNVAPSVAANGGTVIVNEGDTATHTGTFSDPGEDGVTITASIGTVATNPAGTWSWSFDTADGPDQSQTVTVTATDSDGASATTTFGLTVNNVAPSVAADDGTVIVTEGDTATNSGTFSDPGVDGVTITASIGTVETNPNGFWTWAFNTADGPDQSQTVTVTATDTDGESTSTTFGLTVNNVAPSVAADDGTVIVNEGDTATNSGTFSDPGVDGVTITASIGTVTQIDTAGTWAWSFATTDGPDQSQTVTVTATDSDGASTSTIFGLTVNNVAPVAVADSNATSENQSVATDVIVNDTDAGTDVLSLAPNSAAIATMTRDSDNVAIPVATASISESGNQITFHPGTDFDFLATGETATVVIGYTVTDDDVPPLTDTGTLTITVTGTNDSPTATANAYSTNEESTVTGNVMTDDTGAGADSDPDTSDTLTASLVSGPNKGSLSLSGDGSFSYTPNVDFFGTDSFDYEVADGHGGTDTATTTIDVHNLVDVSGRVFNDRNNNGLFEATHDQALAGVTVNVFHQADDAATAVPIATGVSGTNGNYHINSNLLPGDYKIVEALNGAAILGLLDGQESAGNLGGTVDNSQDSNEIGMSVVATSPDATDYLFAEVEPSDLFGTVWRDFNNDGEINFGEEGIEGAQVSLSGTDDRGNTVSVPSQATDGGGAYAFVNLRPGNYSLDEAQPAGFDDGQEGSDFVVSNPHAINVAAIDRGANSANDRFTGIELAPGSTGDYYNFGERSEAGSSVGAGSTATIGFWHNKNGEELIESLNGGSDSTQLGNWLASTFPDMYGEGAVYDAAKGSDQDMNLAGRTNAQIADIFQYLHQRNKKTSVAGGPPKVDAQVMATALAVYVTSETLAGGAYAANYGFNTSTDGIAYQTFNVLDVLTAQEVDDLGLTSVMDTAGNVTILDVLQATNKKAADGLLYDADDSGSISTLELTLRMLANELYTAINEGTDI